MKKINIIYLIIILAVMLISGNVFAQVVTTQRKINTTPTYKQQYTQPQYTQKNNYNRTTTQKTQSKPVVVNRLSTNIKTCKPYTENMKSDYMGMNLTYQVSIEGWINNKCRLNFTAKANGTSSSFESMYGINPSDATVLAFAPKIRCDFTKQQLQYVGDSILQEEERNRGARNNMLKDPNSISFDSFSDSDMKLLDVVLNQQACKILNTEDLNNILQNISF